MVYRAKASLSYGRKSARSVDSSKYKNRLQLVKDKSTASLEDTLYRAAVRKQQSKMLAEAARKKQLEDTQALIQKRIKDSQSRVQTAQLSAANKHTQIAQKTAELQAKAKLGASGLFSNPAFTPEGAAPVRNLMEGRGPSTGAPGALESYKWRDPIDKQVFNLTTAKGTSSRFTGLLNALAATGYNVNSVGTYANRNARGSNRLSEHAHGNAIDINPAQNPMGANLVTDMPKNIVQIAARYGLIWGGTWKSKKDAMHFSTTGY